MHSNLCEPLSSCPLCHHQAISFYKKRNRHFFQCTHCLAIFLHPDSRFEKESERKRYLQHQSGIEDSGYLTFISPITTVIQNSFTAGHKGLDFGCGHTPVLSELLSKQQIDIASYDPIFHDNKALLDQKYDFIICCEVIEHFYHPDKAFELLRKLLKPNGHLICHTNIYQDDIDFQSWYYKNDPTHVFFYHLSTLQYIKNKFSFTSLGVSGNLITFHL